MLNTATDPTTPRNVPFILIGIAVAVGYWLVEAFLDTLLFENVSFGMRLFPSDPNELWMRGLACVLFVAFGVYSHRVQVHIRTAEMIRAAAERRLQDALAKVIEGYVPICAWCKKIRSQDGRWDDPETFIATRSGAIFSHAMCPECQTRHFPDEATGVH